jgi:3-hydroxy-9,10-secoandrosta-1,3,5(10)-triene-9,17-dione monooxygenase
MGDELVERAKSMRSLLLRNAPLSEQRGELMPEVVAAIKDAEFHKIAVPRRLGGLSVSANALARITAELAKACPSTGWMVNIMNTTVWRQTLLSDESQEDMFSNGIPWFCGVGTLPGQAAKKVDGGYLIENGRWAYATGSHHADYFHGLIAPEGEGGPARLAVMPLSEMTIEPTWKMVGMRATGSDTVVATNVFVPDRRATLPMDQFKPSPLRTKHLGDVTDYWSAMPFMRTKIVAALLGAAEGVLDYVIGVKDKPLLYTNYRRKGDSHVFDAEVGKAGAKIAAVRDMMLDMTRKIDEAAMTMTPMRRPDRARNRAQVALCIDLLGGAIDKLMNGAGSSAFMEASHAQLCWRDFNVGSRHVMLIPEIGYEVFGRSLLGEPEMVRPEFL